MRHRKSALIRALCISLPNTKRLSISTSYNPLIDLLSGSAMSHYDFIVIGAGVIGASVAHHLAALGAKSVLVVDRGTIGAGTTSQSSGLLRTHYSVRQNVELARSSWHAFNNFAAYVDDDEASCGLVKCGYMICAPEGDKLAPLQASLDAQQGMGIEVQLLSKAEARERLPIAQFDDAALIGYEPEAGFADAYLVATGFARSARRRGVKFMENTNVTGLVREGRRVTGIETSAGNFSCGALISAQNIWTPELAGWIGVPLPVKPERHTVLALECEAAPYTFSMPAFKDQAHRACCISAATAAARCSCPKAWSAKR